MQMYCKIVKSKTCSNGTTGYQIQFNNKKYWIFAGDFYMPIPDSTGNNLTFRIPWKMWKKWSSK